MNAPPDPEDPASLNPSAPPALDVAVCGPHRLWRQAIAEAIGAEPDMVVVGVKRSPHNLAALLGGRDPSAVIVAVPGIAGTVLGSVREVFPTAHLIVLTDEYGEVDGPTGSTPLSVRRCRYSELADALRALRVARPAVAVLRPSSPRSTAETLDNRELSFLQLTANGRTTADIAASLGISTRTAAALRSRIYRKLAATSQAHAVATALRQGLIAPPPSGASRI